MIPAASLQRFEQELARSTERVTQLADRFVDQVVGTLFTEIRDGGRYSPGTPSRTGRTKRAWAREDQPDKSILSNPLPHVVILEGGSSDQAPQGFVRIAAAAAPLIATDIARRLVAERA